MAEAFRKHGNERCRKIEGERAVFRGEIDWRVLRYEISGIRDMDADYCLIALRSAGERVVDFHRFLVVDGECLKLRQIKPL